MKQQLERLIHWMDKDYESRRPDLPPSLWACLFMIACGMALYFFFRKKPTSR